MTASVSRASRAGSLRAVPRGSAARRARAENRARSHEQTLWLLAIGSVVLLLLSTTSLPWGGREFGGGLPAPDPLAFFKVAVRGMAMALAVYLCVSLKLTPREILKDGSGWLFAYFLFAAVSTLWSGAPLLSLSRALSFLAILFYGTVLMVAFGRLGQAERLWNAVFWAVGAFAAVLALASLAFWSGGRLGGFYHPNWGGSLFGVVFCWTLIRLDRKADPLLLLLALFSGGGLLLTKSRGALAAVLLTLIILALWNRRRVLWLALAGFLASAGLLASEFTGDQTIQMAATEYTMRGENPETLISFKGRIPLYLFLITEQVPRSPWIGTGFQTLSEGGHKTSERVPSVIGRDFFWQPGHAHNFLLQTLVGTGAVGLLLYMIGWGRVWWTHLWRMKQSAAAQQGAVVLLFIFAHAMVETTLSATIDVSFILASLLAGLSIAPVASSSAVDLGAGSGGRAIPLDRRGRTPVPVMET